LLKVNTELILSVPNGFTPDNDGVNDFFFPVLHGADETDYLFSIYDRTGKVVFESTDIHERWNGSYPNSEDFYATDAVFNWRLRARARGSIERQVFTGSVLMLR
jgi:gliding motility-associated-like protein